MLSEDSMVAQLNQAEDQYVYDPRVMLKLLEMFVDLTNESKTYHNPINTCILTVMCFVTAPIKPNK